jgi:hypothetical protein
MHLIHSKVSPSGGSLRFAGFIENPVLNISGRMTISVLLYKGVIREERF